MAWTRDGHGGERGEEWVNPSRAHRHRMIHRVLRTVFAVSDDTRAYPIRNGMPPETSVSNKHLCQVIGKDALTSL